MEVFPAAVGLIIRALVVSARWGGRARRLALEQATATANSSREAALEARVMVLEDMVEQRDAHNRCSSLGCPQYTMGYRQSKAGAVLRQSNQYTRALVNESSVILADEPTGNLDSRSGAAIMDLMQQLHQDRKVTIVLVTHDSTIAGRAERTIRLSDGQVEAVA